MSGAFARECITTITKRWGNILIALILVCIAGSGLHALQKTKLATIQFGNGEKNLGLLETGDGFAAPSMFDVAIDGSIFIPDIFKGRIVVLDAKGSWTKAIAVQDLTPRLRFFRVNQDKQFLMINDQTATSVSDKGIALGSYSFGFTLPSFVWAGSNWYVLLREGKKGAAMVFPPDLSGTKELTLNTPDGTTGLFRDRWSQMWAATIREIKDLKQGDWDIPETASFLASQSAGDSLWRVSNGSGIETFYVLNKDGKVKKTDSIKWSGSNPISGFWTVADQNFAVYKMFIEDRTVEIVRYTW